MTVTGRRVLVEMKMKAGEMAMVAFLKVVLISRLTGVPTALEVLLVEIRFAMGVEEKDVNEIMKMVEESGEIAKTVVPFGEGDVVMWAGSQAMSDAGVEKMNKVREAMVSVVTAEAEKLGVGMLLGQKAKEEIKAAQNTKVMIVEKRRHPYADDGTAVMKKVKVVEKNDGGATEAMEDVR